jgi:hypothetical protein
VGFLKELKHRDGWLLILIGYILQEAKGNGVPEE